MLMTVTNTSGRTLNALDEITGGTGPASLLAVGGARKDPLPYPFGHIGALANSGTYVASMMQSDFRYKRVYWLTMEPKDELNRMVHEGQITLAFATQNAATGNLQDQEELAKNSL